MIPVADAVEGVVCPDTVREVAEALVMLARPETVRLVDEALESTVCPDTVRDVADALVSVV